MFIIPDTITYLPLNDNGNTSFYLTLSIKCEYAHGEVLKKNTIDV